MAAATLRPWTWGALLLAGMLGCQPLPAGRIDAVLATSHARRVGNVILIRGWQDLYSAGIDQLAGELRASGLHAPVFRAAQWQPLAEALTRAYRSKEVPEPLVLIGFSYGADDCLLVARRLAADGVSVELAIVIDPVTPPPVPPNVRACYDYFQTNGIWDAFPWLRGVPLQTDGASRVINVDLRRERPDLVEPTSSHANIAANPKLHREIVQRVLAVCGPRDRSDVR